MKNNIVIIFISFLFFEICYSKNLFIEAKKIYQLIKKMNLLFLKTM